MPGLDGQLTAAEVAAIYALVQAQTAVREQLTEFAVRGAVAAFRTIRSWYDTIEVVAAALEALRFVQPAQLRAAQATDVYMARVASVMSGRTVRSVGAVDITQLRRRLTPALAELLDQPPVELMPDGDLDVDRFFDPASRPEELPEVEWDPGEPAPSSITRTRPPRVEVRTAEEADRQVRPVDLVDVYSRVAANYRYLVSTGVVEQQAREYALKRAATVAEMDVSLAVRAQEHRNLGIIQRNDNEVRGYRRILRPELSKSGLSCGLCIVAADRIYRIEDLKPLHANCNCAVLMIRGSADPGLRLNREDLDRLYKAAGGSTGGSKRYGGALKYVRAVITEHGELGPILAEAPKTRRTTSRRTPNDAARGRATYRTLDAVERLPGLREGLRETQRRYEAGEQRLSWTIDWYRRLINQLERELVAG